MTNNEILKKVTISHNLRRSDVLEIMEMAGYMFSYSQIGTFMLNPDNRKYVKLENEVLQAFLDKLIIYSRGTKEQPHIPPRSVLNSILNLAERDMDEALNSIAECVQTAKKAVEEARQQENDS